VAQVVEGLPSKHKAWNQFLPNITWITTCRMKPELFLTPYTKVNLKWIEGLTTRPEIVEALKKKVS
jgi:hypothetical protein